MKYLVTGGCGFVGFHLAKTLLDRNNEVVIIDNFNDFYDPEIKKQRANILTKAIIYKEDILNRDKLDSIFKEHNFDKVIHLAAQANVRISVDHPELYVENNIVGTFNVFECCRKYNVKNTVFSSTSSVYGNNETPFNENHHIDNKLSIYAYTKRSNELLAKIYNETYGLNIIGLRLFNVYGTHGRPDLAFYIFTEAILNEKPIQIYGTGSTRRDLTHISDVVEAIILAANLVTNYEVINIGNNNPISIEELIELISKYSGLKVNKTYHPKHHSDMDITFADITKAKRLLNWEPKIKIEDGIEELVLWHKTKK